MTDAIRASIVVQTLITDDKTLSFDRWFEAVLGALLGTSEIGAWRIAVADASSESKIDASALGKYRAAASSAGGSFTYVPLGGIIDREEAHSRLLNEAEEDLVIVADEGALLLPSTISRLILALSHRGGVITPREVPLDASTAKNASTEPRKHCVIFGRAEVRNGATLAGAPSFCVEAVVHYDRRLPPHDGSVPGARPALRGSLVEQVVSSMGLNEVHASVESSLSEWGEPLLSIVMRTQLSRPEALRDALLCLSGQSDGRFELLLVVHDRDSTGASQILAEQPTWLRSRARVLSASGGTRSRPLNVGIAEARGSFVAFLDDDDLVFSHWVESFLNAAVHRPRQLLRARAGVQRVTSSQWTEREGHVAETLVTTPYPVDFDLADHLRVNMTPFMALAFPKRFFALFGGADESLNVCEDWDLLLRAASVLGVYDVPELTAVYRRWSSGRDSYTAHDSQVWERDMKLVHAKRDASPLLLPDQSATKLANLSLIGLRSSSELAAVYASSSWRITAPLRAVSRLMSRLRRRDGGTR